MGFGGSCFDQSTMNLWVFFSNIFRRRSGNWIWDKQMDQENNPMWWDAGDTMCTYSRCGQIGYFCCEVLCCSPFSCKSFRKLLRHMVLLRPKLSGISRRNRMEIFAGILLAQFWSFKSEMISMISSINRTNSESLVWES